MSRSELEAAVAATNPVSREAVDELSLAGAERELLAEIVGTAPEDDREPEPRRSSTPRRRSPARVRRGYLGLAAAAAVVALLFVSASGGGPKVGPSTALGDDLKALIEASPPILLDAPGWSVLSASESFMTEGITIFIGPGPDPLEAELQWGTETVPQRLHRMLNLKSLRKVIPPSELHFYVYRNAGEAHALGTTARLFKLPIPEHRIEVAAVWGEDGEARVLRAHVSDMRTFRDMLAALRHVDARTWEGALHGRVVKTKHSVKVVGTRPRSSGPRQP